MSVPRLIVVTGRPAAGKTTLAHSLAHTIRCPAICRDEFKEGLVNTFVSSAILSEHANRQVYDTFFDAIGLLLRNGITLVAEAAFQHKLWIPKLEPLRQIAQVCVVVCTTDPSIARERFIQRAAADPGRAHYHGDWLVQADREGIEKLITNYDPPRLAVPTLDVDTSRGYRPELDKIVEFVMQPEARAIDS